MTDEEVDQWIAPCSNIIPIDESFPQYVIDHRAELTRMGWIAQW